MTVIALPAITGISTANWRLERNVAEFESPLTKAMQRLSRTGHRWRAGLGFKRFQGDNAGVMAAWYDQVSRGDRWLYLSPPQNSVRGNWNPAELVTNGTFMTGTSGWTPNTAVLSMNARRIKVKNSTTTQGSAQQNVTMEAGKPHVLIADAARGSTTAARTWVRRQSDGIAEADTGAITAPLRSVLAIAPTVSAMQTNLFVNTTVTADDLFYSGVSICRCLQVAGASQTGNRLNVDGGPTSINAALKAGEFVCFLVGSLYQLVRLTEDFDADSSGAGTLVFEPALRGSPADNAAVIVRNPFARFRLAEAVSSATISPPIDMDFYTEVIEDVTT